MSKSMLEIVTVLSQNQNKSTEDKLAYCARCDDFIGHAGVDQHMAWHIEVGDWEPFKTTIDLRHLGPLNAYKGLGQCPASK